MCQIYAQPKVIFQNIAGTDILKNKSGLVLIFLFQKKNSY